MDNWIDVINKVPAPTADINRFKSLEWTRKHMENPAYKLVSTPSRISKSDGEDNFFAETLKTSRTFSNWLCLMRQDYRTPAESAKGTFRPSSNKPGRASQAPDNPDCQFLIELSAGLNGFRDTMHGGVLCAILDETLSVCVEFHRQLATDGRTLLYTGTLQLTYLAPLPTPSVVLVKCWLEAREARKWYLKGQVVGEDGTVFTEGEGVWIASRQTKL